LLRVGRGSHVVTWIGIHGNNQAPTPHLPARHPPHQHPQPRQTVPGAPGLLTGYPDASLSADGPSTAPGVGRGRCGLCGCPGSACWPRAGRNFWPGASRLRCSSAGRGRSGCRWAQGCDTGRTESVWLVVKAVVVCAGQWAWAVQSHAWAHAAGQPRPLREIL